jgi:hypothetical protein
MIFSRNIKFSLAKWPFAALLMLYSSVYSQTVFADITSAPNPGQITDKTVPDSDAKVGNWIIHNIEASDYYTKLSLHYQSIADEFLNNAKAAKSQSKVNQDLAKKYSDLATSFQTIASQHQDAIMALKKCTIVIVGGKAVCN